jgi:hypothetical protein
VAGALGSRGAAPADGAGAGRGPADGRLGSIFVNRFFRLTSVSFEIPFRVSKTPMPVAADASK